MKFTGLRPVIVNLTGTILLLPVMAGAADQLTAEAVVTTYSEIAHAGYTDSYLTAEALDKAISALIDAPSQESLDAARAAWTAARAPYQQTEVYRVGNAIVDNWAVDGAARAALTEAGPQGALMAMLTGMGSLSYGELAGKRMQLGLMLHDPEEEHDCFSDNTSASHYYDGLGIRNVFKGEYKRVDGSIVSGVSLESLVASIDADPAKEMSVDLEASIAALAKVYTSQKEGMAYDQLIAEGNEAGNALFNKRWSSSPSSTLASDGLGPLFNARSCQACHIKDGRGEVPLWVEA